MKSRADNESSTSENLLAGALLVEKFGPKEVLPEAPFSYTIRLTNRSDVAVQSVVLTESLVSLLVIESSEPESQIADFNMGRWVLGPIHPNQSQSVTIHCSAKKHLQFRSRTSLSYVLGASG